jgi:hypothetical protein
VLGLAAGFKGLDDDHAPAAARTGVPFFVFLTTFGAVALRARWGWVGHAEELAGQCDIAGSVGLGEEAVMTDAVEPVGQDVDQEAADELVGGERHQLVTRVGLGPVVLPFAPTAPFPNRRDNSVLAGRRSAPVPKGTRRRELTNSNSVKKVLHILNLWYYSSMREDFING